MYPLSDKDLDRLSREAAEQFAVEPHASDWDQLATRLEKEMPVQKEDKRRRALWLLLALLLTCGGGLLWLLTGNNDTANTVANTAPSQESIAKNNTNPATTKNTDPSVSGASKENNISVNPTAPVSSNTRPTEATGSGTQPTTGTETIATDAVKTEKEPLTVASASSGKEVVRTSKPVTTKKSIVPFNNKSGLVATIAQDRNSGRRKTRNIAKALLNNNKATTTATTANAPIVSNDNHSTPGKDQAVNPPAPSSADVIAATPLTPAIPVDSKNNAPLKATDTADTNHVATVNKKAPVKNGKLLEKGFSFGVTAGFDYSRINNVGDNKPGYDVGVNISYALNKRWSFTTGFLLTQKNYTAKGKDFHPPKHYWTTYIALNDVEGNCQMWDIPLNIRYNLTPSKTKWFISSGLSTYIMRKQNYNYYYTVNNNPREKEWSLNSQTNYWFNILNISAGAEKPLNRNWSIQAEPFIKVPLKGVGFGNMNINSYGVLATLKFHPEFKH